MKAKVYPLNEMTNGCFEISNNFKEVMAFALLGYCNYYGQDKETGEKIKKLHNNNKHKFNIPTYRR